jgi:hypothetical protein
MEDLLKKVTRANTVLKFSLNELENAKTSLTQLNSELMRAVAIELETESEYEDVLKNGKTRLDSMNYCPVIAATTHAYIYQKQQLLESTVKERKEKVKRQLNAEKNFKVKQAQHDVLKEKMADLNIDINQKKRLIEDANSSELFNVRMVRLNANS